MKKDNETKNIDERPGGSSGFMVLVVGAILGGFSGNFKAVLDFEF